MMVKFNFKKIFINSIVDKLLIFCLYICPSFSQNAIKEDDSWIFYLENNLDKIVEEDVINREKERLYEVINKQILINFCNKKDLEQLPFLSDRQIESLLFYIAVYGPMVSLHELQLVEGFDRETIQLVAPFLSIASQRKDAISDSLPIQELFNRMRYQILGRVDYSFPRKRGFIENHYRGSPIYHSMRVRIEQYNKMQLSVALERDPGEVGIDYFSGFLALKNKGICKELVVGRYKARYGAGILLNNGFSMGKSFVGASLLTRSGGFTGHASVDEINFLQGIAAELSYRAWRFYPFWSYKEMDARVEKDTIRSFQRSGMHRTEKEDSYRRKAHMISYGMRTAYRGSFYELGLSAVLHHFSHPYYPSLQPYNFFYFRGDQNGGVSLDYQWRSGQFSMAGEFALSDAYCLAMIHTLSFYPTANSQMSILYRRYPKRYVSWLSRSYSEGSMINDEEGISVFAQSNWLSYFKSDASFDFFRFEWLKMGVDKPSWGYDFRFKQSYQQVDSWQIYASYRLKTREKNVSVKIDSMRPISTYQRHAFELGYQADIVDKIYLRGEVEWSKYLFYHLEPAQGILLSQRLGYDFTPVGLTVDMGFALFDTDGSTARVYLSEKNLLYAFGYPSFYGQGVRASLVVQYVLAKRFFLSAKWGNTHYFDRDEIGSGMDLIANSYKHDISFQLRMKF